MSSKASVIMSVYNTANEKMLDSSISSILDQSFRDFEFIIYDDGSSNNVASWIEKWAKKDPRIIFIKGFKNNGLAYALNQCLGIANGEYIVRMDDDDVSHRSRLEKQINFLQKNPIFAFVSCNCNVFDESGFYTIRANKKFPMKEDMLFTTPFVHASTTFRADALRQVNGYRVEKITRRNEDFDLWARLYESNFRGANLQECLYDIREDQMAYKRRKYIYRVDESRVRFRSYKKLGLLFPAGILFVIKPLLVGLIPSYIIKKIRKKTQSLIK